GGAGASTFRREAHVPRGGPDGGDGGRGGSIRLRVDPGQTTLRDFRYKHHFRAAPGGRGERARRHGKAGEDLVLDVPPGTAVFDDATGELLADLGATGQSALAARGGRGGLGNIHFATSTHQAPKHAQKGEPGEERWVRLELRLIADIGLVGLPNAGKSTLLAAVTAARPKIADYPFTTLEPNLGVIDLGAGNGAGDASGRGAADERRPTTAEGIGRFRTALAELLPPAEELGVAPAPAGVVVHRIDAAPDRVSVSRDADGAFRVAGRRIERLAAQTDFEIEESAERFQRYLERSGADAELRRAGIQPGDSVRIGSVELEWEGEPWAARR